MNDKYINLANLNNLKIKCDTYNKIELMEEYFIPLITLTSFGSLVDDHIFSKLFSYKEFLMD